MKIVDLEDLPQREEIIDAPTDDLAQLFKVCQQLEQICTLEHGIGLSAVQVGLPWKLFVVKQSIGDYGYYLNCKYEPAPDARQIYTHEGCLSLRSDHGSLRFFRLQRWHRIVLTGWKLSTDDKLSLEEVNRIEEGVYGVVFQHEIDHQNGSDGLISNLGEEIHIYDVRTEIRGGSDVIE
jgi:peptide deformylase